MKSYKLKQWYPTLAISWRTDDRYEYDTDRQVMTNISNVKNGLAMPIEIIIKKSELHPDFWEEVIEYTPYIPHFNYDGNLYAVTRIKDNQYFNKGMRVKMPGNKNIGFIYGFDYTQGRLVINHTFSYLMNKEGIKDHLNHLRPCLYTKEDLDTHKNK